MEYVYLVIKKKLILDQNMIIELLSYTEKKVTKHTICSAEYVNSNVTAWTTVMNLY